jgi:hypothetical protein
VNGLSHLAQSALSMLGTVLVMAAVVLLWHRSRSPWLLAALVAQAYGLALRIALVAFPSITGVQPLMAVWTLSGIVIGAGLLGYAIEATAKR